MGTRLWPLSRTEHPKQFQRIDVDTPTTFFQATIQRCIHSGFAEPIVSVGKGHINALKQQLDDIKVNAQIIAEPVARNTGPAVLAAALWLAKTDPGAILCVMPSDHLIKGDLAGQIMAQTALANEGKIVLFGIEPRYPDPGFGYIVGGESLANHVNARDVRQFVEKPPTSNAEELIAAGNAFWASGISMFRADRIIAEFARFDPKTLDAVRRALGYGDNLDGVQHLEVGAFASSSCMPTESLIFEKSEHVVLSPLDVAWSDVGAWSALHSIGEKDAEGNVLSGDVVCLGTKNSYVRSNKLVAVIGMENVVVVETDDAMLVMALDKAQDVKTMVGMLQQVERREIIRHMRDQQNWGETHLMQNGDGYELRLLKMRAGTTMPILPDISAHRMLTVASGSGLLKIGERVTSLLNGQSFEVAIGETASVYADLDAEMTLVEVYTDLLKAGSENQTSGKAHEASRLVGG